MNEKIKYVLHIGVLLLAVSGALLVLFVLIRKTDDRNSKLLDEFQTLTDRYKLLQNDRDTLKGRVKLLEETIVRRNEQIKQLNEQTQK